MNTKDKIPMVLVANKMDLQDVDKGHLTELECEKYASELGEWDGFKVPIYFTSAKTGLNVNDLRQAINNSNF